MSLGWRLLCKGAWMRRRAFLSVLAGAAISPLAARAQPTPKIPRIGLLGSSLPPSPEARAAFDNIRLGFAELGYVDGQNIRFEEGMDRTIEQLPALASELVGLEVDVIIALATPAGRAAHHATSVIPIVSSAPWAIRCRTDWWRACPDPAAILPGQPSLDRNLSPNASGQRRRPGLLRAAWEQRERCGGPRSEQ